MAEIMAVDDQQEITELIKNVLNRKGHYVSTADSGEAALALLKVHAADLLIIDKNMPGLSGPDTIPLAKAIIPGLKVILMTAFPQWGQAWKADALLAKPFNLKDLDQAVADALQSKPAPPEGSES